MVRSRSVVWVTVYEFPSVELVSRELMLSTRLLPSCEVIQERYLDKQFVRHLW